jgi:hypothetical protein
VNHKYILYSLLFAILFQGCASLSQEECKQGDWMGIGYQDGSKGYPESRFNKHNAACAEYKIQANFSAYQQGHQRGLEQVYCKPRNGYYVGLNGRGYGNVCPSHMEGAFLAAYRYGHDIYRMQNDANRISTEIRKSNTSITRLDQQIDLLQQQMQHSNHRQDIKHHITGESNELVVRLGGKIANTISSLHLSHSKRRVYTMIKLATKRGEYQAQLDWLREYRQYTRNVNTQQLRHKIRDLDHKISDIKTQLIRQARGPKPVQKINSLIELTEYTGVLATQQRILKHLPGPPQRKDLARFHYRHELPELKNQAHRNRQAGSPAHGKSRQQLRHELHQARLQRDRELHRLDDLNHQLRLLEQDIRHQKASSPYR